MNLAIIVLLAGFTALNVRGDPGVLVLLVIVLGLLIAYGRV